MDEVASSVKAAALDLIGTEAIEEDTPLMDAGLDSLAAVEYQSILSKEFAGVNLPATLMFDMPSIKHIADFIFEGLKEKFTVTEMVGGAADENEDEDEDSSDDASSSDDEPRRKRKKHKPQ